MRLFVFRGLPCLQIMGVILPKSDWLCNLKLLFEIVVETYNDLF